MDTAGEGSGVVYLGGPMCLRLELRTVVLRLREEGVGCSLMGVALSVGWGAVRVLWVRNPLRVEERSERGSDPPDNKRWGRLEREENTIIKTCT